MAYKAIFEIKTIIEDARSNVTGSFITAIKLWEMAVLPALLNSADCWYKMPSEALKKLNKLSQLFLSTILQAGRNCPIMALYWYTGSLLPANRIILMKMMFLHHVTHLDSSSLAAKVLAAQQHLEPPDGLWSECLSFM